MLNDMHRAAEPEPDSPALLLDIDCRDARWHAFEDGLSAHAAFVWAELALPAAEASLVLGDDALLSALNMSYRDKQGPTNVLSFAAQDFATPADGEALKKLVADYGPQNEIAPLLGDIIMSYDRLAAEADAQGKVLLAHAAHLLTHGLLHLLGHDHQEESDADVMEGLETKLMLAAGFGDPYQTGQNEELS